LRSIGHIARVQRVIDNDADYVEPLDMLAELREDNQTLAARLREVHKVLEEHRDIASGSCSSPAGMETSGQVVELGLL
jgi:starvation-inducible DNA-binding protein